MAAEPRTIAELSRALRARELTVQKVVDTCLQQIADRNPSINAYITVLADEARAQAKSLDRELAQGHDRGPLHGVPISLKDIIDVRGVPTTAASRVREGHIAARDSAAAARLREAGAVLIGKTNLHEFAFGTTNEDSAYGPVRHPLDTTRGPGGSSGGSAASVAADMAYASIGTDTGGSIRIPAALCGLVGLKPALGELSTEGVVPLSGTMDHVGPLCRSVEDAAILYRAMRDSGDEVSGPAKAGHYVREARGLRLGVPREYFFTLLDAQVAAGFEAACARLTEAGVVLEDVTVAHASDIIPIYTHITLAEGATYHAKTLESRSDDYNPNVRIRLEMGRYILAEDYLRAMQGRAVLMREVNELLRGRDGLLLPSMAVPAVKLGTATIKFGAIEEPVRNVMLRLTQLFNVTGHPAITIPCGTVREGLPIGAQLVGSSTTRLLEMAAILEPYFGPGTSC